MDFSLSGIEGAHHFAGAVRQHGPCFFKGTPSESINHGTLNTAAAEQFKPGLELYVDFTPA